MATQHWHCPKCEKVWSVAVHAAKICPRCRVPLVVPPRGATVPGPASAASGTAAKPPTPPPPPPAATRNAPVPPASAAATGNPPAPTATPPRHPVPPAAPPKPPIVTNYRKNRTVVALWIVAPTVVVTVLSLVGLAGYWIISRPPAKPKLPPLPMSELAGEEIYRRLLKSSAFIICYKSNESLGIGSGVLIDADRRLVLTCNHIVDKFDTRDSKIIVHFPT